MKTKKCNEKRRNNENGCTQNDEITKKRHAKRQNSIKNATRKHEKTQPATPKDKNLDLKRRKNAKQKPQSKMLIFPSFRVIFHLYIISHGVFLSFHLFACCYFVFCGAAFRLFAWLYFVFLCGVFSRGVISSLRDIISSFRVAFFFIFLRCDISSFRMASKPSFRHFAFCPFVFPFGVFSSFRVASFRLFV